MATKHNAIRRLFAKSIATAPPLEAFHTHQVVAIFQHKKVAYVQKKIYQLFFLLINAFSTKKRSGIKPRKRSGNKGSGGHASDKQAILIALK